ncbi:hypothetical protein M441DRAFT_404488 [Trichoderma asperellum CBS 433.97]|uniref:Uncharacterized protein n=1 Tax=Trichoderma asperellum (strain ATCC 204424 / CBS 433.97 / NBRC 101777) TaxID=1042311 RepID=A0A2T3ZAD8_TRIA4|nr:hypothetical protein M441DRAFT_404488 [Trichoderma asperellum CBS 433.97]PTB41779.1 hypothetical protein M441DRAFT_404488 [Trichoderma asperellum CBS 433.97]
MRYVCMYRCNRFNKCRAPRNFALIFSFFFMLFGAVCLFCLSFSLHSSFFFRKLNIDNKKNNIKPRHQITPSDVDGCDDASGRHEQTRTKTPHKLPIPHSLFPFRHILPRS